MQRLPTTPPPPPVPPGTGITLTGEQQAVVNHQLPGHGRVLAGPGTGKSTTAVALAERILAQNPAPKIKFLTFTRAATAELGKKLAATATGSAERPSTIHSFSISALLQNPGSAIFPQPLRIPDAWEWDNLIRGHLAARTRVGLKKLKKLKDEMAANWESLNPHEHQQVTATERTRFMGAWSEHRQVFGYTLLEELPDLFRQALRDNPDLRGVDFDLLIVDEYQDLNACDLEVLRRLADRACSLIAIGDDDQSIYSKRKAHPEGIRRFPADYNPCEDYNLTICQRSPQRIMQWAHFVIAGDPDRPEDRPEPQFPPTAPQGEMAMLRFGNNTHEAEGVADLVEWLINSRNMPPSEILILSRTDYQGRFTCGLKAKFTERAIPVADSSAVDLMNSDEENRRLLATLRLATNPTDSLAWLTLIHLQHGLGAASVNGIYDRSRANCRTFAQQLESEAGVGFEEVSAIARTRMDRLWQDTRLILDNLTIPRDVEDIAWGTWICEKVDAGSIPPCSAEFGSLLRELDDVIEPGFDLSRFLSQIQPLGKDLMRAKSNGVRFMTMGSSKGLTVTATIIVGVENDLIPRLEQDPAEERRLLYVAMTRSREYLYLTWANRRTGQTARAGHANTGLRLPCQFLRGGPVESQEGRRYIRTLRGA
ncbi:MAG: ATP-dependent helicase [bacterium]|nr:ATP-dependent helicase [bacterium]